MIIKDFVYMNEIVSFIFDVVYFCGGVNLGGGWKLGGGMKFGGGVCVVLVVGGGGLLKLGGGGVVVYFCGLGDFEGGLKVFGW